MNKLDKYLRKFASSITKSVSSRYYTIGEFQIRVSDHIGKNSSGDISIIIDRSNYILFIPVRNKISVISYSECKILVKSIHIHSQLFIKGDSKRIEQLTAEKEELKKEIAFLKTLINSQTEETIDIKPSKIVYTKNCSIADKQKALQELSKSQRKRICSWVGTENFHNLKESVINALWKNEEVVNWLRQSKIIY